ncbi:MAG: DUF4382 domain-containing protein [Cyanobacteria bacterium CRU_2_1]|nr:DUF4382 domain-containing protein [Cyanobacteria bacterium RU_5_0]NJR58488.1 DUF4382 domain-containing protein [Cyanobacteria bacterium CRU_2_1]NJR58514.1 DUF4382 domain-containing protein [Cyanobacteria bacterium CRU_2_1]
MNKKFVILVNIVLIGTGIIQGCASPEAPQAEAPTTKQPTGEGGEGTLQIRANGEDFVRQGFVSKDGWQMSFDHVYVTLADITAYQTEPPYEAEQEGEPQAKETVEVEGVKTIDLAEGDENAEPILVAEVPAPAGRYNALSWEMVDSPEGAAQGYPLWLQGTALKDGQTVNFVLKIDPELAFTCGDFVGENRKGILEAGSTADLEATFHFDHLFGDADTPADDSLNTGALGFQPLATLAQNGQLDVDTEALKEQLSEADYNKLLEILPSLGHVGEGHCKEAKLTS